MVHANLNWTFGPLRHVFASPVFHRWHHSTDSAAIDKNFAPTFPVFDLIWGTFHMPAGVRPEAFGANEPELPSGPVGQTVYPFRGAGRMARRHPALATICLLAVAIPAWVGWREINRPEEPQAVATLPAPHPEDLKPIPTPAAGRDSGPINAVAVNATGSHAMYATRDGSVIIHDIAAGRDLSLKRHLSRVNSLALSPDGSTAVSAGSDGAAVVFEVRGGKMLRSLSHSGENVMSASVSDDGWVATGGVGGMITLWCPRGEIVSRRQLDPVSINTLALGESGRKVVAAQGSRVTVWDVPSDGVVNHQELSDLAYCVNISRDGRKVAAGEYDGRLHVWQEGKDRSHTIMRGHAGPIYALSFSPAGEALVTGGADQVVRVWNIRDGAVSDELRGHAGLVFAVAYDAVNRRVHAAGKDRSLTDWKLGGAEVTSIGTKRVPTVKP